MMKNVLSNATFCIILFLFSSTVYCQSAKEHILSGQSFISKKEYGNAIKEFDYAKAIFEKQQNTKSVDYGKTLFGILLGNVRIGDTLNAEKKFKEIEAIFLADSKNTATDQYELLKFKIDYFFSFGKYEQIEMLSDKFMFFAKLFNSQKNDVWYYTCLYYLGITKFQVGKGEDGERIFNIIIKNKKISTSIIELRELIVTYKVFSDLLERDNQKSKAISIYEEALKLSSQLNIKDENLEYLQPLVIYYEQKDINKADSILQIILNKIQKISTQDSLLLLVSLNTHSKFLIKNHIYGRAINFLIKSMAITEKFYGQRSEYINLSLNILNIYKQTDKKKYDKLISDLKIIKIESLSSSEIDLFINVILLTTFGEDSEKKGDFSSAEKYYTDAVGIGKKSVEPNNYALTQLGFFYETNGNFSKAEEMFISAINLMKQNGKDFTFDNLILAQLYVDYQNKISEALTLYEENIQFFHSKNMETSELALTFIDLAELHAKLGKLSEANLNFQKGLNLMQKLGLVDTDEYLSILRKYSDFKFSSGDYAECDSLINIVINSHHKNGAILNYAKTLFFYGDKLKRRKDKEADIVYQKSINLLVEYLGEDNPELITYFSSLAFFYLYSSKEKGVIYLKKEFESLKKDIVRQFEYLSGQEKVAYVENIVKRLFAKFSSIYREASFRSNITPLLYNNLLLFKSAVLKNTAGFQTEIYNSKDPQIKNLWQNYLEVKNILAQDYKNQVNKTLIKESEDEAEKIEKELVKKVSGFASFKNSFNVEWKNIQAGLKPNEAAIEFVAFPYYSTKWSDSILYVALMIRPGYIAPKYIYLFEEKQLSSILKKANSEIEQKGIINNLYLQKESNSLYKLIWQPLDSLLQGVTTLYAAPSGLMHNIALGAVPLNDSSTASSKYGLQILGTTGDIVNKKDDFINKKSVEEAIVFGGINYDVASTKPLDFKSETENKVYAFVPTDSSRSANGKFDYLGASLIEAQEITNGFKNQTISTHFYSDSSATETLFKNIPVKKNAVIHIATHGYFFPDIKRKKETNMQMIGEEKQTAFKASENPLLRSGLIFAGANPAWTNPDYISTATDDGILTAYEISNMDLSNVKLVVLSACETGLGDIKGSEGVFGLQRSFKMAGVKNIIMSLWKVPDEKTRELMQTFYQFCFSGKSVSDAFRAAQETMRIKYPASPYFWAGFSLLQ